MEATKPSVCGARVRLDDGVLFSALIVYSEQLIETQRTWAQKSLDLTRELLPLMTPVAKHRLWTREENDIISALLCASARSSESTLLLCAYGQLWDAEVVVRSVFEGTLKFAFLLKDPECFPQRLREYSDDLFQISLLKDHHKAKDLLSSLPDPEARTWKPIRDRVLNEEQLTEIQARYSRATRRELDRQWGFTGIIGSLSQSDAEYFRGAVGLAFGYSIGSHVHHADCVGTALPMERDFRDPERRDSLHLAHLARLISDVFTCLYLRLLVGYRSIGHDTAPLTEANERIKSLQSSFGTPYEDWMRAEYGIDSN